jgi:hypothetical protein
LTLGALVVHLLAGCCWHHAHAAAVEEAVGASHDADHDADHDGCQHQQPGHSHRETGRCCQARCLFVRPASEQSLDALLAWGQAISPPAGVFEVLGPKWSLDASVDTLHTPLRVHLLNQVILI